MQHAIYEPHTFLQFLLLNYIFVFTTRFFRLDLFLNTAIIFIFLKTRLIFECESNVAVSAAIMLLISLLYSSIDPGNIQHSFSLFCFWVRRDTVGHIREDFSFLFDIVSIE